MRRILPFTLLGTLNETKSNKLTVSFVYKSASYAPVSP